MATHGIINNRNEKLPDPINRILSSTVDRPLDNIARE
jgi:hypothetical protein